jgi:O-antigen/teichoic acid export membrane protein
MKGGLSRNTFILTISNIGGAGLSFLLTVLIGRMLGERGLGVYAVALAWVYPLNLLVEFGLGTLMMRDLASRPEMTPNYLRAVVSARLIMGGIVVVLLLVSAPLISSDPVIIAGLHVSAPMVVILPLFSTFTAVFRARQVMMPVMWLNLGMLAAQLALTWLLLASGGDVVGALILNTVTSAGQLVAAWAWYRARFSSQTEFTDVDVQLLPQSLRSETGQGVSIFRLLGRAAPFALAAVFAALQARLTIILLESYTATTEVGYFTAANRFVEAARLLPNAFFGALFPVLSGVVLDQTRIMGMFKRAMRALALFGVLGATALIVLGGWLLPVTFGAGFAPAVPVLQVLALSLPLFALRGARTIYWYACGGEHYVNWVNGGVVLMQLALGMWLIPLYGAVGAALCVVLVDGAALALLSRRAAA